MRRRVIGAALALATTAGLSLVTGTSAQAATVETTIGGVTYRADDAAPGAGATVVEVGPDAPLALVLPASVVVAGTTYAVRAVGDGAADGLGLTSVSLPDSLTTIGDTAFGSNALTSLVLPDSVTSIGTNAFSLNQLTTLELPDALTLLDEAVFAGNALTSVQLPDSLVRIASAAFAFNALTAVTIPASVTGIAAGAFTFNTTLTTVTFAGAPPTEFTPTGGAGVGSLGDESAPTVRFPAAFAAPGYVGGYTTPTWQGYAAGRGLAVAPARLPGAVVGTPYDQTLTARGGTAPYTFSVKAGSLPAGLGLTADGRLLGTPTLAGTSTLTVTVTDAVTGSGAQTYSLVVSTPVVIPPGTTPPGTTPPGTPPGTTPPGVPPVAGAPGTGPRPRLKITKVVRTRAADGWFVYRITAKNRGPGRAVETRIRFANAPAGVLFPRRTVRIGTLREGRRATVVLKVRGADRSTVLTAQARARNAQKGVRTLRLPAR